MRRTAAALTGVAALATVFSSQAVAATPTFDAPNARAAAQVSRNGDLERQKNVVDSFQTAKRGVYCVLVDPKTGIDLADALILANGGPETTSVQTTGKPTADCKNRSDTITVTTLDRDLPTSSGFTIAVL